jgi:dTDP-4-amino-4,6-dideoxygalactose transaminase
MTGIITPRATDALIDLVHDIYGPSPVPLHRPVFEGNERRYLTETIDSNFVSSVGARVTEFEERIAGFTGCKRAIATMNGTAALHMALLVAAWHEGQPTES